jgi:hypothetical protein
VAEPAPVPVQVKLTKPEPETPKPPPAAPVPLHPAVAAVPATNYNIPAFIAAARGGRDKGKWILFGSAAAFLGVVWAAISLLAK